MGRRVAKCAAGVVVLAMAGGLAACSGSSGTPRTAAAPTAAAPIPGSCADLDVRAPARITGMELTAAGERTEANQGRFCTFNGNGSPDLQVLVLFYAVTPAEHAQRLKEVQDLTLDPTGDATEILARGPLERGEAAAYTLDHAVLDLDVEGTDPDAPTVDTYTLTATQLSPTTWVSVTAMNNTGRALPWQQEARAKKTADALLAWAASAS